ncbi:MAG: hypothetical protein MJZ21_01055 [archaeon]|nr:hypothetical protein [archaeon]
MFGVIGCINCNRKRVVDLSTKKSTCPYCGTHSTVADHQVYFKSTDAASARAALTQLTGSAEISEKKKPSPDTDPYSTLEYEYEHCHGLEEKMEVLSKGLTRVYGEFTYEELEKLEPKNAEKILKAMLVQGYVHETKYGRYTAN